MDERRIIKGLKENWPIKEGSTPGEITAPQQRAANLIGRLLNHAHRRGKRRAGRWI